MSDKIKVLFLIHDLGSGGAEKVLVNLVNHMDKTRFDITVTALFGGGVNEQFLAPEIHFRSIFPWAFPGNSHVLKLFSPQLLHRMFIREKYDIEVSYLEGPSARIISGCPNKETKLISWIHIEQHTKEYAAGSFRNFKESECCYERFDKTICVSEFVKHDFLSIYPQLRNIEDIYNTNETNFILEQKDEAVDTGLFSALEFKLCFVGKIKLQKGIDRIASQHIRLREAGYPVHFYILGVGPEEENIRKQIANAGYSDSFTFLGYQTNPYKYVSKCDLFICTSHSEGFSTAATEALIVGTPVVTMEVSGMKEMLGANNEYGIIVPQDEDALFESVKDLLDHPDKLAYYKSRAIERGKFFSTENTVNAVEDMLKNL